MSIPTLHKPNTEAPFSFGTPVSELYRDPSGYDADDDLAAAVRVALLLGMPLLLTGEPGCGKTSVAHWLAWKLGLGTPLVHNIKSTTLGRELLYEFDELARFRDSQAGEKQPTAHYLRLNALGLAILFSGTPETIVSDDSPLTYSDLASRQSNSDLPAVRFAQRYVVLIDELDKAPRDTPNDLLLEIEHMRFRIGELNGWINGTPEHRPIVVITSNSEKSLPEPFLRRCVFHYIKTSDDRRRRQIVARRQHPFAARGPLFEQAMRLFDRLHDSLGRPPGTAELLAWLTVLEEQAAHTQAQLAQGQQLQSLKGLVQQTLGTLAKTKEDLDRAGAAVLAEGLS